jgi:hypothetical protein
MQVKADDAVRRAGREGGRARVIVWKVVAMSTAKPLRASVKHTKLADRSVPEGLAKLDAMCTAGAACPEVQASPLAVQALAILQARLARARGSFAAVLDAEAALRAATKQVAVDFDAAAKAVRVYELAVDSVADGDLDVITGAGLLGRDLAPLRAALGSVTVVKGRPGKAEGQAVLTWPVAKGATGYAIEVSFTPDDPAGPWTPLGHGNGRSKVVQAPAPGAQLLARVAAVARDGTRSDWSPPILVTAR